MTNFGKGIFGLLAVALVIFLVWFMSSIFFVEDENIAESKDEEVVVYETEVDGPTDCASFEKYDSERKICSFECESEVQCTEMQKQIDLELASWAEELQKDTKPVAENKIKNDTDSNAVYGVTKGENISIESGEDTEQYRKIWKDISALSPDNLSDAYIETFEIFDSPTDDTLAFVDDQDQNGKWRVAVNLSGHKTSTEREQKSTFIHELAHIISLNSSQVVNTTDECSNFKLDEGCANTNSYVNFFKKSFWKDVGRQEFEEDKFVTEYASTNEVEDLAESFAFFVLGNKSVGSLMKDEKVNFFYKYPELLSVRNEMRNVLSKDIVRAKKSIQ